MQWLEHRIPPPIVGALLAAGMWGLAQLSAPTGWPLGLRIALATTRRTDSATETLRVAGLLEAVRFIGGGDLVSRHKPDPEVVRLVLEKLGCAPVEALMIGDTTADVAAAHGAGVACWAVLGGTHDERTLRDAGADLILSGIGELTAALDRRSPSIPRRR